MGPGLGTNESRWQHQPQCSCDRMFPNMAYTSVYVPSVRNSHPPASPGDSPRTTGRSGPGSCHLIAFALATSVYEILCAPFKSEVSISPTPVGFPKLAPLAFKAKCSGVSFSQCRTPRLGSLMWGSELSLLWENLCNITILQFVGCLPRDMGFDYIASPPLLLVSFWFLLYVFSYRRSFLVGSSLFHQ